MVLLLSITSAVMKKIYLVFLIEHMREKLAKLCPAHNHIAKLNQ